MTEEDRPVIVRTSASANDWWCRERPGERPEEVASPVTPIPTESGLGHALLAQRAVTPFGRQKRPWRGDPPPPPPSPINCLRDSRAVQLHLLRQEIEHAESDHQAVDNLRKQLGRAWTVNHALVGELKKQAFARS